MSSAPVASIITPVVGREGGGEAFAILGSGLVGASVSFGDAQAAGISVHESGTVLVGVTPAHESGNVKVNVITPAGASSVPDGYTFE
ncbi:IPT/TIG domain-containing protein [Streptomyces kronopolitis]|uniref:IPT/TIG domain-containing protein n=1 Tax=Streptomyces kronopolitis TaxID=1612435 RepID=UPI00343FC034